MKLETGEDCGQELKLDRGILLKRALVRNSMISQNASIPAVLSFTTDLIGEEIEDGRLRFVWAFLIPLGLEMSSKSVFFFFLLFSLPRRICSPFSFTIFLVLHAQVSSAAILFAENSYTKQFFSRGKKFLTQNKLVCGFFFTVSSKTMCGDFKGEQKCGKMEVLV